MNKSMKLCAIIFIVAIGIIFLHTNITSAQQLDSFFDVFFEATEDALPELSVDVVDPELQKIILDEQADNLPPEMNENRIPHDDVAAMIREFGLFENLPAEVPITLPDGTEITADLRPGAIVYKWGPAARWCNGPHKFDIKTVARVNQWIQVSMGKTNIAWKVFKPGPYYTDCMYLNIHSNGTLTITLENLGPLWNEDGTDSIPTAYAISDYIFTEQDAVFTVDPLPGMATPPIIDWVEDNNQGKAENLPKHAFYKIWNRIFVGANATPGTYTTAAASAVITVIAEM